MAKHPKREREQAVGILNLIGDVEKLIGIYETKDIQDIIRNYWVSLKKFLNASSEWHSMLLSMQLIWNVSQYPPTSARAMEIIQGYIRDIRKAAWTILG